MQQYIREVYSSYPSLHREKLLLVRTLIFDIAKQTPVVGEIEETLKWGEPAYQTRTGSTIRMDWKEKRPNHYSMYFTCSTILVESFRIKYGDLFQYEGKRAIHFPLNSDIPILETKACIRAALLYKKLRHKPLLGL